MHFAVSASQAWRSPRCGRAAARTAGAQSPREAWRNRHRRKAVSSNQDFGRCRNAPRLFVVGSERPWKTTMPIATHSSHPIACASRLRAVIAYFLQRRRAVLKGFGPYAAIVLFLPGGCLLAPLLWLYRRRQRSAKTMIRTRIASVATERRMPEDDKRGRGLVCVFPHTDLLGSKM